MTYQDLYDAGLAALRAQRATDAIEPLSQCTQMEPEQAEAWLFLGVAHGMLDQVDQARSALERAGRLAPSDARVAYNLGRLAQRAGDLDAAREHLQRCLALDPANQRAREAMATLTPPTPAALPDQVIVPTQREGVGQVTGWVEVPEIEPMSVLRMLTMLTLGVCLLSAITSMVGATIGLGAAGLGGAALGAAVTVLLQPALTGLFGALNAVCFNACGRRFAAPRMRLEEVAGRQRMVEIEPMGAGRALVWWSLPGYVLVGGIVLIALLVASSMDSKGPGAVGALLGGVAFALIILPMSACLTYIIGIIGALIYNLVANFTGGIEGNFSTRGAQVELTDLAWQPTVSTLFWCNVPLVLLMGALAALTAVLPDQPKGQTLNLIATTVAVVLSPVVKVLAYRLVQPSMGGYRFGLRSLD